MITNNKELMRRTRETLKGKWGLAVGGYFIYFLITVLVNSTGYDFNEDITISWLSLVVTGPLTIGMAFFSLYLARNKEASISQIFYGFNDFIRGLVAYLLMCLFVILWSLLLIIPGIIALLAYSQVFFILAEDKSIGARDAIRKSKAMMHGHKKQLFFLGLRFLGWLILSILTLGIGLLWFMPYVHVTLAMFHDEVSGKHSATPVVS